MNATATLVATWNLEWAPPRSPRGRRIRESLEATAADVVCATEACAENLPAGGHQIDAEADYGYPLREGRRKVILWSREPWRRVDRQGHPDLPPGRFVAGSTDTAAGSLRFVGVCIPWADAHVRTGRRDRSRWQDHRQYLAGLHQRLAADGGDATVLLGDFNQTIPRVRQPADVAEALASLLHPRFEVLTAGLADSAGGPAIDHIACTRDLSGRVLDLLPKSFAGAHLSDHFGVTVMLKRRQAG